MTSPVADIVAAHSSVENGKNVCFVPSESSSHLLVILAPHNQGNRFTWIKALVPTRPYNLLYLNNPEDDFYLDHNAGATYREIIFRYVQRFGADNSVLMGSSMSGTAALRFALQLGICAFVSGPQICAEESREFAVKSFPKTPKTKLIEDIQRLEGDGRWIEMTDFFEKFDGYLPPIYLRINNLRFDTRNAYRFIDKLMRKPGAKFIFEHDPHTQHGLVIQTPTQLTWLQGIVSMLLALRRFPVSASLA